MLNEGMKKEKKKEGKEKEREEEERIRRRMKEGRTALKEGRKKKRGPALTLPLTPTHDPAILTSATLPGT